MNLVIKKPEGILKEYVSKGLFSTKLDIYSFGVLLLEVISTSFLNLTGHVSTYDALDPLNMQQKIPLQLY